MLLRTKTIEFNKTYSQLSEYTNEKIFNVVTASLEILILPLVWWLSAQALQNIYFYQFGMSEVEAVGALCPSIFISFYFHLACLCLSILWINIWTKLWQFAESELGFVYSFDSCWHQSSSSSMADCPVFVAGSSSEQAESCSLAFSHCCKDISLGLHVASLAPLNRDCWPCLYIADCILVSQCVSI